MEPRIAKLEQRLDDHDRRLKNVEQLHAQLISLTADLSVLVTKLTHMETSIETISSKLTAIDKKVETHLMEPAVNWSKFLWIIGSAAIGFALAQVFKLIGG